MMTSVLLAVFLVCQFYMIQSKHSLHRHKSISNESSQIYQTDSNSSKSKWRGMNSCDAACTQKGVVCGFYFKECCTAGQCEGLFWKSCPEEYLLKVNCQQPYPLLSYYQTGSGILVKEYAENSTEKNSKTETLKSSKRLPSKAGKHDKQDPLNFSQEETDDSVQNGLSESIKQGIGSVEEFSGEFSKLLTSMNN